DRHFLETLQAALEVHAQFAALTPRANRLVGTARRLVRGDFLVQSLPETGLPLPGRERRRIEIEGDQDDATQAATRLQDDRSLLQVAGIAALPDQAVRVRTQL